MTASLLPGIIKSVCHVPDLTLYTFPFSSQWHTVSCGFSSLPARSNAQLPERRMNTVCRKSLSLRASPQTGVAIRFQNAKFSHFSADLQLKDYGFPCHFAPQNDRVGFSTDCEYFICFEMVVKIGDVVWKIHIRCIEKRNAPCIKIDLGFITGYSVRKNL